MKNSDKPRAPAHLSAEAKKWWNAIVAEYCFETPDSTMTLQVVMECFDRANAARELLRKEGIVIRDRFGVPKAHPATVVERDSRMSMLRALRQLGLDILPPGKVGRPPGS